MWYLGQPREGDAKDESQSKEEEFSNEGLRMRLIPMGRGGKGSRGKIKGAEIYRGSSSPSLASVQISHTHVSYSPTPCRRNVLSKAKKRIVYLSRTCLWTFPRCACEDILVTFLAREGKLFRQTFFHTWQQRAGHLHWRHGKIRWNSSF